MTVRGAAGAPAMALGGADGGGVSQDAHKVRWLLSDFASGVRGLQDVVVVSSDGLLLAASEGARRAEDLAAVVSGLVSLGAGAARVLGNGSVKQTIVTMDGGHLFLMAISDGSCLGVHASLDCDLSVVAYQMALLVERAGHALTPEVRSELHRAMAAR
ncbi:roadblock/LC7 domain-containing protein [Peterkaempfera bronchialis]|nr:roadblock/LC7 domain-containing protein [Peterkaempfera bronchialis]